MSSSNEISACRSIGKQFQAAQAACATTMALHDLQSMRIDLTQDAKLNRELVRNELEQSDRFDDELRQFDFWELPERFSSERANAIAMSMNKHWAGVIGQDIDSSGLCCQSLDGIPMLMARAIELAPGHSSSELTAMIDFGFTRSTFCLAWQGRPVFVRVLRRAGFDQIVERVCEKFSLRPNEAAELLIKSGLPDASAAGKGTEIQKAIAEVAGRALINFCEEIKRTMKFLDRDTSYDRPVGVWLSGGGSTIDNLGPWLSSRIDLPFQPWRLGESETTKSESLFANSIALSTLAWKTEEALS